MAISFKIPKGYSAPEGVKEGVEFSEIATFKFEGDEMMILTIGQDKTPILSRDDRSKAEKPKGAKAAIKEQLSSLEDKKGSEEMDEEEAGETPEEEASEDEEME
jgi:hypothetical protein